MFPPKAINYEAKGMPDIMGVSIQIYILKHEKSA